jgi:hypothetical protein
MFFDENGFPRLHDDNSVVPNIGDCQQAALLSFRLDSVKQFQIAVQQLHPRSRQEGPAFVAHDKINATGISPVIGNSCSSSIDAESLQCISSKTRTGRFETAFIQICIAVNS